MVSALYFIANAALTPFEHFSNTPESEYICTNDRFLLFDFVTNCLTSVCFFAFSIF